MIKNYERNTNMARSRRVKVETGAFYHISSRITGKQFLLHDSKVKNMMLSSLERSAIFSGVKVGTFCIMDDHFHILLYVPSSPEEALSESEILDRIEALSGKRKAEVIHDRWERLNSIGEIQTLQAEKERWIRRMYDLSQFVKTFKEEFRRLYQKENDYSGRLWGDRFYSTVIESGEYLTRCAAYIEMNPVRAGIVKEAKHYAWNSSGLANQGNLFAKACREWLMEFAGVAGGVDLSGDTPQKDSWLMKRWPQLTKGGFLGSYSFVSKAVSEYQRLLFSHSLKAREFACALFASHGYRIAKKLKIVA